MPAMEDRERLAQFEVRVEEQGGRIIEVSQQIRQLDLKIDAQIRNLDLKIDTLAVRAGPENGRSVNLGRLLMFPIVAVKAA